MKIMLILPAITDHLSSETTKFSGCFIEVSLYNQGTTSVRKQQFFYVPYYHHILIHELQIFVHRWN